MLYKKEIKMDLFGKYENNMVFEENAKKFLNTFHNKKIVIWGKARILETFLNYVDNINIAYIVDINHTLHNTSFMGVKILPTENLLKEDKENTIIIITPHDSQQIEIIKDIKNMGFKDNNFCLARDLLITYNYIIKHKVILPNIEFIISSACSLKCTHCIANVPYFQKNKSQYIPFIKLKQNIDDIFKAIDYVEMFQLATGEVLMHPELIKILDYIHSNYKEKYNELTFVTNATILPNKKTLTSLKKHVGFIQISHYIHPSVDKNIKISRLKKIFEDNEIKYIYSRFASGKNEWNDIGDLGIPKNRPEKANDLLYNNCSMNICKSVHENKIYPCTAACYASYGGINEPKDDKINIDFVDITGPSIEVVKFYLKATTSKHPTICDCCNGIGPLVNDIFVPAGAQLK